MKSQRYKRIDIESVSSSVLSFFRCPLRLFLLLNLSRWSPSSPRPHVLYYYFFFLHGATGTTQPGPPHYRGFMITFRHITLGRTPLDKRSARSGDLYITTHNTHKRQTSVPPAGFESTVQASKRLQNHALDRAATGIGQPHLYYQ